MKKPLIHPLTVAKIIFTVLGIAMLIPALLVGKSTYELTRNGITTSGTVIELAENRNEDGVTYAPIVEFETQDGDKATFRSDVSSYPASYDVNEAVQLIYLSSNPSGAQINSFGTLWFIPLLSGATGLLFSAIGIGLILYHRNKKRMIRRLKRSGRQIETIYTDVSKNTSVRINGRSPFRIHSQYEENGALYTFESENIWFNPSAYLQANQKIIVLVDQMDLSEYYMDLSFLPEHK